MQQEKQLYVEFKYSFLSAACAHYELPYILDIDVDIIGNFMSDFQVTDSKLIGKHKLKMLLVKQAIDAGEDTLIAFDSDEYANRIAGYIIDSDFGGVKSEIFDQLGAFQDNSDVCILERLSILPEYRGLGIGKLALKDAVHNFSGACGLFVLQSFPLQLEFESIHESDFEKQMRYDLLEKDPKKANMSLKKYYKSCGFKSIKGYDDLLFLSPSKINKKMDKISLDKLINIP